MMEGHSGRSSARIPMSGQGKPLLASSFLNDIRNGQTARFGTPPVLMTSGILMADARSESQGRVLLYDESA